MCGQYLAQHSSPKKTPPPLETSLTCPSAIRDAINAARVQLEEPGSLPELARAAEAAEIIGGLTDSSELALALLARAALAAGVPAEAAAAAVGAGPAATAAALTRLGALGLPRDWSPERGLDTRQTETLRKMLLAVVSDPRLVLARLAEELVALRHARTLSAAERARRALEARAIYGPLANRLGVWQLKWELEDLAFRYLQPADYKRIAAALNARRSERENYMDDLQTQLRDELQLAGIDATIEGRPKHIYSIWRKMQAKQLAFEQLMDIRAARVLVNSVAECYAALGVVHSLWQFIAGEFDDYIATPKDNRYRSIHTAVIGPGAQSVEIQIRTHEMHADSERGVAAHWRYKEGGRRGDQAYERKINQLRSLLAPTEGGDTSRDFLDRMRVDLFQDRIYVISPKGEIVDVPVGGTPLDFAYQVHTDLGHRTRGAKINGRMVP